MLDHFTILCCYLPTVMALFAELRPINSLYDRLRARIIPNVWWIGASAAGFPFDIRQGNSR